jgi:predicted DNA-binding transcriptional regulator YafY
LRAAGAGQDPDAPDPSATRRARRSDADFEAYADAEETVIKHAALLSFGDARLLTTAVTEGRPVTVEYVDPSGRRTVRGLSGLVLKDADLHAWCHLRDDELVFPLSRIHSVVAGLPD